MEIGKTIPSIRMKLPVVHKLHVQFSFIDTFVAVASETNPINRYILFIFLGIADRRNNEIKTTIT